ncbi:MAG: 3-demethylubiquinone-9 3-methyltransferase [Pseudomonas sp.]|nr:3-demethylubiquinone-9 3-methyltransferase [Pseudomonas sp.]
MQSLQKITPCLWFDDQAEQAVAFYTNIFKDSRVIGTTHYGEAGFEVHQRPAGSVMSIIFELEGQTFTVLNGGPVFTFNEAISLQIYCQTQAEIDHYWDALSAGGPSEAQQCGWLKDKFGVSWQVVPTLLLDMIHHSDAEKSGRVMMAMLQMKKLDLKKLERAFVG